MVIIMENQDFVIENGVLKKYNGPGGDVVIPEGVKSIERAFFWCRGLTSVTIPGSVRKIGESAFEECTRLTSVTIPEGVTEIGWCTFKECTSLTSVTISEKNPTYQTKDGMILSKGGKTLEMGICGILNGHVTIPESVTAIGDSAFYGCTRLKRVVIPKSVTTLGNSVFKDCRLDLVAPYIPIGYFDAACKPGACAGFAVAYLDGSEMDEEVKAGYLKGQKKRLLPLAMEHDELLRLMLTEKMQDRKVCEGLLTECDQQQNIAAKAAILDYMGKSLKPVDEIKEMNREFAAMERAAKDLEVFQSTGVMKVGEAKKLWKFKKLEDGSSLVITEYKGEDTEVVIPKVIGKAPVKEISWNAFSGCKSLTSVTIPGGVTKIGGGTFS